MLVSLSLFARLVETRSPFADTFHALLQPVPLVVFVLPIVLAVPGQAKSYPS